MADLPPAMIGLEEPNYEIFADAVYRQEGGPKARKPYGVLSVPVKNEAEARAVAINSARKNFQRWQAAGKPGTFVEFFANRWTPKTADPKGNANWVKNVPAIYAQLLAQQEQPKITPVPAGYVRSVMPNYTL